MGEDVTHGWRGFHYLFQTDSLQRQKLKHFGRHSVFIFSEGPCASDCGMPFLSISQHWRAVVAGGGGETVSFCAEPEDQRIIPYSVYLIIFCGILSWSRLPKAIASRRRTRGFEISPRRHLSWQRACTCKLVKWRLWMVPPSGEYGWMKTLQWLQLGRDLRKQPGYY